MRRDEPWLTDKQQQVWRRWVAVNAELPALLHRRLQADSGLSLSDFEVLVQLTDTPEGRIRVTDLADAVGWERSRLSHHLKRMEGRDLVERQECKEDGRGAYILLTPTGRQAIERAAPSHARTVKELIFAPLTAEELNSLATITDKVLAGLALSRKR
jgi:DNA-binding MarR family transcriptional regulator